MERDVSPIYHGKVKPGDAWRRSNQNWKMARATCPTILAGEKFVQKFVDDLRVAFALEGFHRFAEEELAHFDFA